MRYLLIACLAFILCGCQQMGQRPKVDTIEPTEEGMVVKKLKHYDEQYEIKEFEYDGCQYIVIGGYGRLTVTHKGNCKFCEQRNK